jgi:hypothetical protein
MYSAAKGAQQRFRRIVPSRRPGHSMTAVGMDQHFRGGESSSAFVAADRIGG